MFKKSLITFLIITFLGMNFSGILTAKAQFTTEDLKLEIPTLDVEQPKIPSTEEMESVISSAPESFEVSLAEMAICNTGIYGFVTNILNSLNCKKNIMIDLTILTGIYILLAVLMIY